MLQTLSKISCSRFKAATSVLSASFSTNNSSNDSKQNPWPKNQLDLPPKQPFYQPKTNYNFEQFKEYKDKYQQALKDKEIIDDVELKIQTKQIIPRRQRRVYNAPKFDWNISNYNAWVAHDREFAKVHEHGIPVACKIALSPKYLQKAFGFGVDAYRNKRNSLREYDFEDNNLDQFLLYDYRATTAFHGPNRTGFDYENQEHVEPRKRITKYPTPEEFWNSEEEYIFRLNCTPYADFRKFKKWIMTKVNEAKELGDKAPSYHDKILAQHGGKLATYDDYNAKHPIETDMAVFKYNRSYFLEAGEKLDRKSRYHEKVEPAKKLDDKHKIEYNLAGAK